MWRTPYTHLLTGEIITTRVKQTVDKEEFPDLFSELVATVKEHEPLQLTKDIVLRIPTKGEISELQDPAVSEERAQAIMFKEHLDEAMKLFDGQDPAIWNKFVERWRSFFFGTPDPGK